MSSPTQCKATTRKGERCRNSSYSNSDYCHVHYFLEHGNPTKKNNRDERLVNILAVGASLILIVEKAAEYVPDFLQQLDNINLVTPNEFSDWEISDLQELLYYDHYNGIYLLADKTSHATDFRRKLNIQIPNDLLVDIENLSTDYIKLVNHYDESKRAN